MFDTMSQYDRDSRLTVRATQISRRIYLDRISVGLADDLISIHIRLAPKAKTFAKKPSALTLLAKNTSAGRKRLDKTVTAVPDDEEILESADQPKSLRAFSIELHKTRESSMQAAKF
ncbi:uncharacterized protein LOC111255413 [Varroa destructor]|uniref:Uncharacterized protein n=1 Tax=Varroa destructor TaxID=109461 RepID=A0A7M7KWN6_VARDE|nr:uncharacterized protein LOC111255413 [Varroa destructor]